MEAFLSSTFNGLLEHQEKTHLSFLVTTNHPVSRTRATVVIGQIVMQMVKRTTRKFRQCFILNCTFCRHPRLMCEDWMRVADVNLWKEGQEQRHLSSLDQQLLST